MADRHLCGIFWSPEGVGPITMPWGPHLNLTALQKSHFLGPLYWELGLYSRNWGGNIQNITSFNISCFIILLMWIKMTFLLQSGKFLKSQCFFTWKCFSQTSGTKVKRPWLKYELDVDVAFSHSHPHPPQLEKLLFFTLITDFVFVCVVCSLGGQKLVLESPEFESKETVSCQVWILGAKVCPLEEWCKLWTAQPCLSFYS